MKKEAPVVRLISSNKLCNLDNTSATERAGCLTGGKISLLSGGERPGAGLFKIQMCKLATMKGQAVGNASCLPLVANTKAGPISL